MNMVPSGDVDHPSEWEESGYNEILNPPKRYRLINQEKPAHLLDIDSIENLQKHHKIWINEALPQFRGGQADAEFSNSITVGDDQFVVLCQYPAIGHYHCMPGGGTDNSRWLIG